MKFSIPEPCHEDWTKMTPTQQGAFCSNCQKDVVDFTKLTDTEVLQYLNNNSHKPVCGKIDNTQLQRLNLTIDEGIIYTSIRTWKKYLAILIICFGVMMTSCDHKKEEPYIVGALIHNPIKISYVNKKDSTPIKILKSDTIYPPFICLPPTPLGYDNYITMGVIAYNFRLDSSFLKSKDSITQNNGFDSTKIVQPILNNSLFKADSLIFKDSILKNIDSIKNKINAFKKDIDSCSLLIYSHP
jgi:hypothetical protein